MTGEGWLFMIASVGGVLTLVIYCFWRVLSAPAEASSAEPPEAP